MKPIIIGVSGKKQSGKSTLCKYLKLFLSITEDENWEVCQDDIGNVSVFHGKDGSPVSDSYVNIMMEGSDKYCSIYAFADPLKKLVCMQVLGLSYEQVYGTDEQKSSLTKFYWENMPDKIRRDFSDTWEKVYTCAQREFGGGERFYSKIKVLRAGPMTAREIMQIVGTDIFRKYFDDNVWVNAVFNMIEKNESSFALIEDVRFASEVNAILERGGYVIRLKKDEHNGSDKHGSEVDLDDYDFDVNPNCFVIDNSNMDIMTKNRLALDIITEIEKSAHGN